MSGKQNYTQQLKQRVYLTPDEKRKLIKYGKPLGASIRNFISIVSYSTFRKWITGNVNKGKGNGHTGRKRTPEEIRELVVRLARENNWGYTRILGI